MARSARIIVPGVPHHVTQRGNRRQQTFFCEADYLLYRSLLFRLCSIHEIEINAWCLMPNHVHLVLTPASRDGLISALSELHRRYTTAVNLRENWRGCLWQGRFFSVPLSKRHFKQAVNYVYFNPERAGITSSSGEYRWRWSNQANQITFTPTHHSDFDFLRKLTRSGRPFDDEQIRQKILDLYNIDIRRKKPGPKKRPIVNDLSPESGPVSNPN